MDISFIIFIDYEGNHIKQCIESVKNSIDSSEIIVINNNCKEENLRVIEEYDSIKLLNINERNQTEVVNNAIRDAKGNYIIFLQDIDYIDITGINILRKEADKNDLDIVKGNVIGFDLLSEKYSKIDLKNEHAKNEYIQNSLYRREFLINNNIFLEKENTDIFTSIVLREKITDKVYKSMNVTCMYTLRQTSKYKYNFIFQKKAMERLKRISNSYEEVFSIIEGFDDDKKIEAKKKVSKTYLHYLSREALNHLNIEENKREVLDLVNSNLERCSLDEIKLSEEKLKLIELIKKNDLDSYFSEVKRKKKRKQLGRKRILSQYVYQKAYDAFTYIPTIRKRALFIVNMPQVSGNFEYIKEEIDEYNKDKNFFNKISYRTIYLNANYLKKVFYPLYIGMANNVLLAENIPYITNLKKKEKTKVIQTWHAAGAFKKFGHSTSYMPGGPNPFTGSKMELHSNYDIATVSSEEVVKHYAEAFRMEESNVIPIGLPRADIFFDEDKKTKIKSDLFEKYEYLANKKVILYAPTFRGNGKKRSQFDMKFDFNRLAENIPDDYIIVLKLHPSVKSCDIVINENVKDKVYNMSDYPNINELLVITDILIADYSSVVFEYSLLERPIIFYAYDLESYAMDRDLYYNYQDFIPGPLTTNMEELIDVINKNEYDLEKVRAFASKFFVAKDGNSSKRLLEQVILANDK